MTEEEIVTVFEALLGCPPRAADLAVLQALEPTGVTVAGLAAYMHDHLLGEPEEPTLESVEAEIRRVVDGRRQSRAHRKP